LTDCLPAKLVAYYVRYLRPLETRDDYQEVPYSIQLYWTNFLEGASRINTLMHSLENILGFEHIVKVITDCLLWTRASVAVGTHSTLRESEFRDQFLFVYALHPWRSKHPNIYNTSTLLIVPTVGCLKMYTNINRLLTILGLLFVIKR
jgi:hypothetical protein